MNGFEKNSKLIGYNYNGGMNYITKNGNKQ